MYRKILITTDGSKVSCNTAREGVRFAQQMGAEAVALFVAPEYQYPVYVEIIPPAYPSEAEYRVTMEKAGAEHLRPILQEAEAVGLRCTGITVFSDATALKIVAVAQETGCDLIFMGSHGRSGWGQLLLGSVTSKPVLVHRLIKEPGT